MKDKKLGYSLFGVGMVTAIGLFYFSMTYEPLKKEYEASKTIQGVVKDEEYWKNPITSSYKLIVDTKSGKLVVKVLDSYDITKESLNKLVREGSKIQFLSTNIIKEPYYGDLIAIVDKMVYRRDPKESDFVKVVDGYKRANRIQILSR